MKCPTHQSRLTRCFCLTFLSSYLLSFLLPASLAVAHDFAGGMGDSNDPYQIATAGQLISIGSDPNLMDKHYVLLNDIDLDPSLPVSRIFTHAVIAARMIAADGEIQSVPFSGRFDGNGFSIKHLTISGEGWLGLFGRLDEGAQVIDLGIVHANITGTGITGIIAGHNAGTVIHCQCTGEVSGIASVGGLVGKNLGIVAEDCYFRGAVSGVTQVGGLAGWNAPNGNVTNCHSTGSVFWTGLDDPNAMRFGGLIGANEGQVTGCYSHSTTSGISIVGGLVGRNGHTSSVSNCYSTGAVSCVWGEAVNAGVGGGLVGQNYGSVTNCYSTATVFGPIVAGGLVGWSKDNVSNCYSAGKVSGNGSIGGLTGYVLSEGAPSKNCFWDTQTSGLARSASGIGLTSNLMQDIRTFLEAGWDFVDENQNGRQDIWRMPDAGGYPILSQQTKLKLSGRGTPDDPYLVFTAFELATVRRNPAAAFELMADLNLLNTRWLTAIIPAFYGRFNGNGFVISNMTIDSSDDLGLQDLGLFGKLGEGAEVHDLGVVDVNITNNGHSESKTGGIVGYNEEGRVFKCFSTGRLYGRQHVGGIVGMNRKGSVSNCYSAATVSGAALIGGIVGQNAFGDMSDCYSTGTVQGNIVGGIVGGNTGSVNYCYSTSVVSALYQPGAGGLVGRVPNNNERVASSFWDIETSGQTESLGGVGLTTVQMQDLNTYLEAGWGFTYSPVKSPDDLWWMPEHGYPRLWWQYGYAYAPSPADAATNISPDVILQWNSGGPDLRHAAYFGEDEALVANATPESQDVYGGPQAVGIETYDPGILEWGKTYYWRIDGINEIDPNGPWQGEVWSFTTADSVPVLIVDDFESYDDLCNRIYFTWQDGWGHSGAENIDGCNVAPHDGNGSNALVGHADPPFAEQVIVHEGAQSLAMGYDNENWPWFSEARRTWSTPRDWTIDDADALTLYFRGEAGNAPDSLYMAIEDSQGGIALLVHSDAQAVRATEWRAWRIPLDDLAIAGVDVTAIRKLIIGVGDRNNPQPGGMGRIYIDDIHLLKRMSEPD